MGLWVLEDYQVEQPVCLVLDLVEYLVEVLGLVDLELVGYLEVDLVDYLVEELVDCLVVELVVFLAVVLEDFLALELVPNDTILLYDFIIKF